MEAERVDVGESDARPPQVHPTGGDAERGERHREVGREAGLEPVQIAVLVEQPGGARALGGEPVGGQGDRRRQVDPEPGLDRRLGSGGDHGPVQVARRVDGRLEGERRVEQDLAIRHPQRQRVQGQLVEGRPDRAAVGEDQLVAPVDVEAVRVQAGPGDPEREDRVVAGQVELERPLEDQLAAGHPTGDQIDRDRAGPGDGIAGGGEAGGRAARQDGGLGVRLDAEVQRRIGQADVECRQLDRTGRRQPGDGAAQPPPGPQTQRLGPQRHPTVDLGRAGEELGQLERAGHVRQGLQRRLGGQADLEGASQARDVQPGAGAQRDHALARAVGPAGQLGRQPAARQARARHAQRDGQAGRRARSQLGHPDRRLEPEIEALGGARVPGVPAQREPRQAHPRDPEPEAAHAP